MVEVKLQFNMDVRDEVPEKDTKVFFVTTVCEPTEQDIEDILNICEHGTDCDDDSDRNKDEDEADDVHRNKDEDEAADNETVDNDDDDSNDEGELVDDDENVKNNESDTDNIDINVDYGDEDDDDDGDEDDDDDDDDQDDQDASGVDEVVNNKESTYNCFSRNSSEQETFTGNNNLIKLENDSENNLPSNNMIEGTNSDNSNSDSYLPSLISEINSQYESSITDIVKQERSDDEETVDYSNSSVEFIQRYLEEASQYQTCELTLPEDFIAGTDTGVQNSEQSTLSAYTGVQISGQNTLGAYTGVQNSEQSTLGAFTGVQISGQSTLGAYTGVQNSEQSTLSDILQETGGYSSTNVKRRISSRKKGNYLCYIEQASHSDISQESDGYASNTRKISSRKKRNYSCDVCGKHLTDKSKLKKHKRFVHSSKEKNAERESIFKCDICGRKFKWSGNLKRHIRWHKGQPRYKKNSEGKYKWECIACGKTLPDKYSLKAHLRVHTGERPYKCDGCDATFAVSTSRYKHMKYSCKKIPPELREKKRTLLRNLPCPICNALYNNRWDLNKHLVIHTGERNYACHICRHTFSRISTLNRHVRRHKNDVNKPFKCSHCLKCFVTIKGQRTHELKCSMGLMCK